MNVNLNCRQPKGFIPVEDFGTPVFFILQHLSLNVFFFGKHNNFGSLVICGVVIGHIFPPTSE